MFFANGTVNIMKNKVQVIALISKKHEKDCEI